jgi:serine/threonine-protein kinase
VNNLTRTGAQMGTVFYMSPEQVKGERVDIRSDIYSLGITLYELLTANVPFSASSEFQVLNDHVNTPPPPPSKFYPYLPKGLENIILKSLEKNPDERFQTAEEFGAALERPEAWESYSPRTSAPLYDTVLAGGRTNVTAPPVPPPAAVDAAPAAPAALAPATPMPRKAIAAAALILALAGGGAYLYSRSKAPAPPSTNLASAGSGAGSRPTGQPAEPDSSADQMKPLVAPASDTDASAPTDSALSTPAAAPSSSHTQPPGQPVKSPPRRTEPDKTAAAPPPETAAAPEPPPAKPAASAAELDEARQRFIRLRSKALALKSSLGELRQRLASQGLSVNSDAVEAEGNMDSYMLEADRALQAGDLSTAGTNLDRAEHEIKKIAAVFGR